MKKKIMSLVLAAAMVMSLGAGFSAGAVAVEPALNVSAMSVSELAHLDTKSASPALKDAILNARCEIVYAPDAGWSLNGDVSVTHADGTVEVLPKFSDLYPGWNLTEISNYHKASYAARTAMPYGAVPDLESDELGYYLYVTDATLRVTTKGDYIGYFTANGSMARVRAETIPGERWNAAVRNEDTLKDDAYKGNMKVDDQLNFTTSPLVRYGIRVSSPDKGGHAAIVVTNLG